jgi:hypothetical protein
MGQFNNIISFKLDDYTLSQLENYCHDSGRNTSQTIREALQMHFLRHHKRTHGNTGNTAVEAVMASLES